jgi:putative PEP-CTERM system TPR-repeat lipoprotein
MPKKSVALVAVAFAITLMSSGCDRMTHYTEQERIQRAKDFEDRGNLKSSIIELKNVLQKNPKNPQARLLLGQIYLKSGMGSEAEKEFSQAEKLGVGHEAVQLQLGEALLLMGEYQRVLDEIQPGERTSKTNLAYILRLRADSLFKQGKLKDACNLYQESLQTDTSHPPTYWGLAQCAIAEHDLIKAREWLDSALKIKDKQAQTWIFIGDWEQLSRNPKGALDAYTAALRVEPNNQEALQNRAALYMAMGQLAAAQADVEKVTKLAPRSIATRYLQALLSFEQKQFPAARDAIQQVLQNKPDHMPSLLLAGATAYSLGSYQQAESNLNRFLASFPQHAYARRVLAATQIKQRQPEKALETLAPLLSADTKDATSLSLAGEAYLVMGEPSKAAPYVQRAAALDSKNASIQTQLGLTHLSMGNDQLGINELAKAASLDPNQQNADVLLVRVYLNHKEYDKALSAIEALEKKSHNTATTYTMRGSALLGKNDLANARKNFEQALTLDPTFFAAVASLAQLDLHDKKPQEARKRFERVLDKDKNNLQAMMTLAEMAAINKQEGDYINWLGKAAKAHPQAITPQAMLVRHYLSRNQAQKALSLANEVVNANPDNPVALDLLGSAQLAMNDKSSAISTFSKMAQKADQSPDALVQLALAQISDNKLSEARKTLQKALKLKPDHQPSLDALIKLDMKENQPDKALQLARQIQIQTPQSPLGFEREGDIHLYQKHPALAVKAFEQAMAKGVSSTGLIQLHRAYTLTNNTVAAEQKLGHWLQTHPNDLAVRAYAAESYTANGRNKEAIAQYQSILQQKPDNALLLNNLAGLYQREADSRARAVAEQAFKLAPDNPAIQDTLGWILVEQGQPKSGLPLLTKALAKVPDSASIRYHHAIALARSGATAQARNELKLLLGGGAQFAEAEAAQTALKALE